MEPATIASWRRSRLASRMFWCRPATTVTKGAALIVLEAMKMEITLTAPRDGTIDVIRYVVGDMVEEGTELIHFAETAAA